MACLSSSPPPMMPEDDEEEEDSSLAEGYQDLSESDNASFDLTGLSEKLHSIPKDAIHVTPKEFSRPSDAVPEDGQFVIRLNGLGVPQSSNQLEDFDQVPELELDPPELNNKTPIPEEENHRKSPNVIDPALNPENERFNHIIQDSLSNDEIPNGSLNIVLSRKSQEDLSNELSPDPEDEVRSKSPEELDNDPPSLHLSEPNDVESCHGPPSDVEKSLEEEEDSPKSGDEDKTDFVESSFDDFVTNTEQDIPDKVESCLDQQDDDFGAFADFDSNNCWAQPEQLSFPAAGSGVAVVEEVQQVDNPDRVLHLEDDDDDDDFGDFDSAGFVSAAPVSEDVGTPSSESTLQSSMAELKPKLPTVITNLFTTPLNPDSSVSSPIFMLNPNPSVDGSEGGDETWLKVREIETTPALELAWKNSTTQSLLMKMLKIDPRNIVLEAKPRKFSPGGVPAFASGLSPSGLLQPIKAETLEPTPVVKSEPQQIIENNNTKQNNLPPAQFDWQTSGLKNPLDQSARPNIDTQLKSNIGPSATSNGSILNKEVTASPGQPRRSREAVAILESFPLLNFMQSQTTKL